MSAQPKPKWQTLAPRFMCGHPKTAENTAGGRNCRACLTAREERRRRSLGVPKRKRAEPKEPWCDPLDWLQRPLELRDRRVRPPIPIRPSTLAAIESCREEYARAIGQMELFSLRLTRRTRS